MYNLEIKFTTPVIIKPIDKSFERMLKSIDCPIPVSHTEIENVVTIENIEEIPDPVAVNEMAKTINEHFAEGLKNSEKVNMEVCGETVFVGFTKIEKVQKQILADIDGKKYSKKVIENILQGICSYHNVRMLSFRIDKENRRFVLSCEDFDGEECDGTITFNEFNEYAKI